MGVPQRRRSKARNRRRRAVVMKIEGPNLNECPQCHELKLPHRACSACGYYKDRQVIANTEK